MILFDSLKSWARHLKLEIHALYFASKHPHTPRRAKVVIALVVGYALSPIDLIPDFIPVLGYLDDLILLPLGVALAIKMIPHDVIAECRLRALALPATPANRTAAITIVLIWLGLAALFGYWVWGMLQA
jgi:uncharacterized membrane protein YkvA (DUF1232 family)